MHVASIVQLFAKWNRCAGVAQRGFRPLEQILMNIHLKQYTARQGLGMPPWLEGIYQAQQTTALILGLFDNKGVF